LRRAERRAVQPRSLRLAAPEYDLERERRPGARALERNPRGRLAEADQLRVRARPRREALRSHVQRLEQVRLPRAVRPDDEHEPRLEPDLEPFVGAVVAKRDRLDDQSLAREAYGHDQIG